MLDGSEDFVYSDLPIDPHVPFPGKSVRVEAVMPDGRRGALDVALSADKPKAVGLRIG